MSPLEKVTVGMAAEKKVIVTHGMTVGHVLPGMPAVYGTPTMILHVEMAAGSAIQPSLPAGYVSVGMMVNIHRLAATPIGRTVRAIARIAQSGSKERRVRGQGLGRRPQDRRRHAPARHRQCRRIRKAVWRHQAHNDGVTVDRPRLWVTFPFRRTIYLPAQVT